MAGSQGTAQSMSRGRVRERGRGQGGRIMWSCCFIDSRLCAIHAGGVCGHGVRIDHSQCAIACQVLQSAIVVRSLR